MRFLRVCAWVQYGIALALSFLDAYDSAACFIGFGCFFLMLDLGDELEKRRRGR